jgi:type II restriction enzyme
MVALGKENGTEGLVEAYIYSFITGKNKEIAAARSKVARLKSVNEVEDLLSDFNAPTLTSSADRLFEILATAVFKTELNQTAYTISIDRPRGTARGLSVDNLVDLVAANPMPLVVDRLGHTNAADAGLDIWTNFGVAVNVKRRVLTSQLFQQIVKDTPIGSLHIVCLDIDKTAMTQLKKLKSSGLNVSITTKDDLLGSVKTLLNKPVSANQFVTTLVDSFDKEFPMARTLNDFATSRGYSKIHLSGRWKNASSGL